MKKAIEIDNSAYRQLEWLAANYFVVKGDRPLPLKALIERLINSKYSEANPREYISPSENTGR